MGIQYDVPSPGDMTLTDEYDTERTLVIPAATSQMTRDQQIADFFAASVPPVPTRAEIISVFAGLTGFTDANLAAFFAGGLS